MATEAFKGQSTQFQISTLSSGSVDNDYTTVEECRITNYTNRAEQLDATNHDSTGGYREQIAGPKTFTVNFGGNFLPHRANHQNLQTLFDNDSKKQMRFRWPQTTPHMKMTWVGQIAEYSANFDTLAIASFTAQAIANSPPAFASWS